MTTGEIREPRRVLLGLGAEDDMRHAIEAAVAFAAAVKSELFCILVQQEDLINFAGLPFARAYGPGGFASPLTLQAIEQHFNRLARTAEKALAESCARNQVTWQMRRPQGGTLRELSSALEIGDIVVVNLRDIQESGHDLFATARRFLERAAAVVVPSSRAKLAGPIIAISDGPGTQQAAAIAHGIGNAIRATVVTMDASEFQHYHQGASVIVAPLDIVGAMGEGQFLHQVAATGATAMLVAE